MLTVTTQAQGDVLTLHCRGRIVRGEETAILCSAVRQVARAIVLDLSEVEIIDAAGIGALVSLQAAGIYLRLANPSQPVRDILRLTKLDSIFEVTPSESSGDRGEGQRLNAAERACHATAG